MRLDSCCVCERLPVRHNSAVIEINNQPFEGCAETCVLAQPLLVGAVDERVYKKYSAIDQAV